MYNMQFQHSAYSDNQAQYDISNMNHDNKAVFPSSLPTASLDNKVNQNYNNMTLGNSSKTFANNRAQQYDYTTTPNFNNNNQPISISTNNAMLMRSPTSPNQPQQYTSSSNSNNADNMSESLISPTSPNSVEDEILQRKQVYCIYRESEGKTLIYILL